MGITLPHSQADVDVVHNEAQAVIQSLLTDPRIAVEDCIFAGTSPFERPSTRNNVSSDPNTGNTCTEAHEKLIHDPKKQILLPVIFHIDGACTGQFVDLPVTAVRIGLGMFTRVARDKEHLQ